MTPAPRRPHELITDSPRDGWCVVGGALAGSSSLRRDQPARARRRPPRGCCATPTRSRRSRSPPRTATSRRRTATRSTCGATATARGGSSCPARRCASPPGEQGDGRPAQHAARGHVDRLPRADGRQAERQPGPAAVRPGGSLTSLVQPAAAHGLGDLHLHGRQPGHLPLRERHRRQQAGADGPVRRAGRAAGRAPEPGQRPRRLGLQRRPTSTCSCSPRSTPTCTWPSSAASPIDWTALRPLLHDQRPQHAGHAGARTTPPGCPTSPTARWCTSSRTTRRPTRAGRHPLPQRRNGQLPVPPARQRRARRQQGRPGAAGAEPAQDLSYLKYDIDVQPGQTVDALMDWRDVEHWDADDQPDPDTDPGHHRPAARRHGHVVQREPLPRHEEPAPDEHHRQQRVRRVLPRGPQPRARAGDQLRRNLRRDDDGLPHRPARRLPGEAEDEAMTSPPRPSTRCDPLPPLRRRGPRGPGRGPGRWPRPPGAPAAPSAPATCRPRRAPPAVADRPRPPAS